MIARNKTYPANAARRGRESIFAANRRKIDPRRCRRENRLPTPSGGMARTVAIVVALLAIVWWATPAIAQSKAPARNAKAMPDAEIPLGMPLASDAQDIIFIDGSHVLFIRL